jgi:hypothetical protein
VEAFSFAVPAKMERLAPNTDAVADACYLVNSILSFQSFGG